MPPQPANNKDSHREAYWTATEGPLLACSMPLLLMFRWLDQVTGSAREEFKKSFHLRWTHQARVWVSPRKHKVTQVPLPSLRYGCRVLGRWKELSSYDLE